MTHKLIPRLTTPQAMARLEDIRRSLQASVDILDLVQFTDTGAAPNATGGATASTDDLRRWRDGVRERLDQVPSGAGNRNDRRSLALGRALAEVIDPSRSDTAHDGTWSFLSLCLFPDVVFDRWPPSGINGALPEDRWIGAQLGRDRNYLKVTWRRWTTLGSVLLESGKPLGEDEFVALMERSSLARNTRLLRLIASEILRFDGEGARSEFARQLVKNITKLTGPRDLEFLDEEELRHLVTTAAAELRELRVPRRASRALPPTGN